MLANLHVPVLAKKTINFFCGSAPERLNGKLIIDATIGGGGHSAGLLENGAKVIGLDCDEDAIAFVNKRFSNNKNFSSVRANFSHLEKILANLNIDKIEGILFDFGMSSNQLENANRGFSFQKNGNLDMRLDRKLTTNASDLLASTTQTELEIILKKFGEESPAKAKKIAHNIIKFREDKKIETTKELKDLVEQSYGYSKLKNGKHVASKTFQAIRIAVNDELKQIEITLPTAIQKLKPQGKIACITFHSLEDRIVKNCFKEYSQKLLPSNKFTEPITNPKLQLTLPKQKIIFPTKEEIAINPRSRSAKLRTAIKI